MTTNGKKKPVSITVSSSKSDLIPDKTLMHLRFTGFSTKGMPYGEGLVFGFAVVSPKQWAGHEVTGMVTKKDPLTPKSKEWIWIKALLGREPMDGEEVTEATLLNTEAMGLVVQIVKRSGTYNRVDKLMPLQVNNGFRRPK